MNKTVGVLLLGLLLQIPAFAKSERYGICQIQCLSVDARGGTLTSLGDVDVSSLGSKEKAFRKARELCEMRVNRENIYASSKHKTRAILAKNWEGETDWSYHVEYEKGRGWSYFSQSESGYQWNRVDAASPNDDVSCWTERLDEAPAEYYEGSGVPLG